MPNLVTLDTPPPTACTLWLPRKSRYCHFAKVGGFEFCAHHLASRGDADDAKCGKRIPCPLDPTHSVFERDLARHLKKCPKAREAREEEALPGFARDVNAGAAAPAAAAATEAPRAAAVAGGAIHYTLEAPSRTSQLGVVAREELLALVGRVERAHASLDDAVRGDGVCVACVPDDGAGGLKTKKHAVQNEAIVDAIGRLGLVDASPAVHVEFGAGKGGLTQALAARCAPSEHVLVDRFTPVNNSVII